MKKCILMFMFSIYSLTLQADFKFRCLGDNLKNEDCIKQFQERDTLGFLDSDGNKNKSLKNLVPSQLCSVTSANTSCEKNLDANGLMTCTVKNSKCTNVKTARGSDFSTYECEGGASYRAVGNRRSSLQMYEAPICIPKFLNASTHRPPNKIINQPKTCDESKRPRICNGTCMVNYSCNNGKWEESGEEICELCDSNENSNPGTTEI